MFSNCGKSFCAFIDKCFNCKLKSTNSDNIESQD